MKAVITGLGAVTAAGRGVPRFINAAQGHGSFLRDATEFAPPGLPIYRMGIVPSLALGGEAADDRAVRIALPALVEALRAARIAPEEVADRVERFLIGTSLGGMQSAADRHRCGVQGEAVRAADPRTQQAGYHGPTLALAARIGLRHPSATYNSTCSSGLTALEQAVQRIELGEIDAALVGAVDALCPFAYAGFHALHALTLARSEPYHADSEGMILAEGAAFVVIESEATARRRGAVPLATIEGVATTLDAFHPIAPHPEGQGLRQALERSLAAAGRHAGELRWILGHGVGTLAADQAEFEGVARSGGGAEKKLVSWKGHLGHPLAAAGLLSVVRGVVALKQGRGGRGACGAALSAGLGGQAAAAVLGEARPAPPRARFAAARLQESCEPRGAAESAALSTRTARSSGGANTADAARTAGAAMNTGTAKSVGTAKATARKGTGPGPEAGKGSPSVSGPVSVLAAAPVSASIRDTAAVPGPVPRVECAAFSLHAAAVVTPRDLPGDLWLHLVPYSPAFSPRHLPPEGSLCIHAVQQVLQQAGESLPVREALGLVAAAGYGSLEVCAKFHRALLAGRAAEASPALFTYTAANAMAAATACVFGFRGPNLTSASNLDAALHALLDASVLLRSGCIERAVIFGFVPEAAELRPIFEALGVPIADPFAVALIVGPPGAPEAAQLSLAYTPGPAAQGQTSDDDQELAARLDAALLWQIARIAPNGCPPVGRCTFHFRGAEVHVVRGGKPD